MQTVHTRGLRWPEGPKVPRGASPLPTHPSRLTGGAHQQGTLGDLSTQLGVLVRVLQEVDHLLRAERQGGVAAR